MNSNINLEEKELSMENMEVDLSLINGELSPDEISNDQERLVIASPDKVY